MIQVFPGLVSRNYAAPGLPWHESRHNISASGKIALKIQSFDIK